MKIKSIHDCRADFPILRQNFYQNPLVYLDNGATTQKPQCVIDAISDYYTKYNANVHRGVYALSTLATEFYENTRKLVKQFIHAADEKEIIFTSGATESINLIASCFEQSEITAGDEIIISTLEHHSNIVPWQRVCENKGAKLKIIPLSSDGTLDLNAYQNLLNSRVKLVAVIQVSNVLGIINPVKEIIAKAHAHNIPVLIDGAQVAAHLPVDVQELDCDFYVFSSHKMYGPTGVGVLYGKRNWLERLPPYQSGGDMIRQVSFAKTEYQVLPYKFEAGTPNIAGVIAFAAAIEYLMQMGFDSIIKHEKQLTDYALSKLSLITGLKILAPNVKRVGVISFVMDHIHPHDIASILDRDGIAVRAGHHCAMPLMEWFGVPATTRISFGIYNNTSDIDCLIKSLEKIQILFGVSHVSA